MCVIETDRQRKRQKTMWLVHSTVYVNEHQPSFVSNEAKTRP